MTPKENHLSEERLIAAVLAEEDLSQAELDHLALCPSCQVLRNSIAADLAGLEELGSNAVQVPPRSFQLPNEPPIANRAKPGRLGLALGGSLALAAAALVAVWLGVWGPQSISPIAPPNGNALTPLTAAGTALPPGPIYDDPEALAGLGIQEMEAFSPFQQFVLGGDQTAINEEFMDFIMPESGGPGRGKQGGAA